LTWFFGLNFSPVWVTAEQKPLLGVGGGGQVGKAIFPHWFGGKKGSFRHFSPLLLRAERSPPRCLFCLAEVQF